MKIQRIVTSRAVRVSASILFVFILLVLYRVWPSVFAIVLAIGGTFGALTVVYEVRLTKQIAQGEFIRELQSAFVSDENIMQLWSKLLLGEDIVLSDRPLVSSYLTFFETLYLLVQRNTLDLGLIDDLFRNRFFTAVGDRGIQQTALIKEAGSFTNIHSLISVWHGYLLSTHQALPPGYFRYIRSIVEAKGFHLRELVESDIDQVMRLQERVAEFLPDKCWLRSNSWEMMYTCLSHHPCMGVFLNESLVALGVLYDGEQGEENIEAHLSGDAAKMSMSINLKLIMSDPLQRSQGLSRTLVELLEQRAIDLHKRQIACTVHHDNEPSGRLFRKLGYRCEAKVLTSYGKRDVYIRELPSTERRWAR